MSRALESQPALVDERAIAWRRTLMALAVLLAGLAWVMHDAARRLVDLWLNSDGYGHGLIVVPVMLYLVWLDRGRFAAIMPRPWWPGLLAVAALMAMWLVSHVLGIVLGVQLALVLMLLALPLAVAGPQAAKIALPSVLFLFCAVPVWSYLVPMLQSQTAVASAHLARSLGIPVYLEGLYISIPDGQFLVAEVCSGLRYLLAALSLGAFYALLNLNSLWTRIALVAGTFLLGIVFNWVRVVGIVAAGHYSHMQSFLVHSHIVYGWVLFLLVVGLVLLAGRLLERVDGPRVAAAPANAGTAASASATAVMSAVVLALMLAPAWSAQRALGPAPSTPALPLADLAGDGWSVSALTDPAWRPEFFGVDAEALRRYTRDGEWLDLYVAFYSAQRQDAEAVNDANDLFAAEHWERYALEAVAPDVRLAADMPGSEIQIRSTGRPERRVLWYSYWVDGVFTNDRLKAKLLQLRGLVAGRHAAAAVVVSTPVERDAEVGRARLREFFARAAPALRGILQRAAAPPRP